MSDETLSRAGENILERHKGGRIVLYVRDNSRGSVIHYRISVRGLKGYERRSTKTTDIAEARDIADERYFELARQAKRGERVAMPKTVKSVAASYLTYLEKRVEAGAEKQSKLKTSKHILNATIIPWFGDKPIDKIRSADLRGYLDHRTAQTKKSGKKEDIGKAHISANTAAIELAYLSNLMSHAVNGH